MGKGRPVPVVMIHGAHGGAWAWDNFAERFRAAGYAVQCPVLRFHDMARPPEALATTSLKDYAADLEELLGSLKEAPVLVGHGMGGLLAQKLVCQGKASAAVLLAPSAPWGVPPSTLFEMAAAQSLLLNVGFWNKVLAPDLDYLGRHAVHRFPPAERAALLQRLIPESGRAVFETVHWGLDMGRASEIDPRKADCPLLVLAGGEDRLNPPGTVERVVALYKGKARFEKLPAMGHWLMGEPGWELVADKVLTWLKSFQ